MSSDQGVNNPSEHNPTPPPDGAAQSIEQDNLSDSSTGTQGTPPLPVPSIPGQGKLDRGRLGPQYVCDVICNATSKGTGMRCKNPAVTGSVKCRHHGGASLRGASHPGYKHGRYSKHLPTHLRDDYEDARFDDDLLSNREELALLTVRVGELTSRLNFGNSGNLWLELRDVYDELQEAMRKNEVERMTACLMRLGTVIKNGNDNEGLWSEIKDTIETVNRVRSAENKRQVELRQLITAPHAIALVMSVVQIVQRNVTDPNAMSAIHRDVTALLEYEQGQEDDETQSEGDGNGGALEENPGAEKHVESAG